MNNALSGILRPTALLLILANLIPLFGVILLRWEVFPLMLLFWAENVIVGVINVVKMLMVDTGNPKVWAAKLFMVPFFCVHYGIFTLVHGIFVFVLFGGVFSDSASSEIWEAPGLISNFGLVWAIAGIALSHIVSFAVNFIGRGEYKKSTLNGLMQQPYGRVIILHMTILGGGFLMMLLGSPVWGLALLVFAKIALDVRAHIKEHGAPDGPAPGL